jgi:hypothetical protein
MRIPGRDNRSTQSRTRPSTVMASAYVRPECPFPNGTGSDTIDDLMPILASVATRLSAISSDRKISPPSFSNRSPTILKPYSASVNCLRRRQGLAFASPSGSVGHTRASSLGSPSAAPRLAIHPRNANFTSVPRYLSASETLCKPTPGMHVSRDPPSDVGDRGSRGSAFRHRRESPLHRCELRESWRGCPRRAKFL